MQRIIVSFLFPVLFTAGAKAQDQKALWLFMNRMDVSRAAKEYYLGKFKANINAQTYSILDSIETKNSETRPFYLYLATQIMKSSDGALSEELGLLIKEYVEQHTDWALEFLQSKFSTPAFISIWASAIAGEIMIDCEGQEKLCAKKWYETANKKRTAKQKQTLEELYRRVCDLFT